MRTRILALIGGVALGFSITGGGAGVASADTFLGTTNGCNDYIDSHGHITTICRAEMNPGFVLEIPPGEEAQKVDWKRGPDGLNWPMVVKP